MAPPKKTPPTTKKPTAPTGSGKAPRKGGNWKVIDVKGKEPEEIVEIIKKAQAKPKAKPTKKPTPKKAIPPKDEPKAPKPHGRPSKYTPELATEIVLRISKGEPLRQICRDEHMPHWTVVYDWQTADKEFSLRIAHARELGEEAIAQECIEIADNATNDWMANNSTSPNAEPYRLNGEHVQRSKLRIETRLKLLAKWNPRKWGEKVDLNHGVQPENPLATMLQRIAGSGLPVIKDENAK